MPRKSPIDIGLENTTTFRLVNPDDTGNVAIARLAISETGCVFHLMGFVKVFRTIATNGDAEHWASSNSQETWAQIDKLLKEKLPLSGIARVTGISGTWLQRYVNRLYEKQGLEPQPVKKKGSCV